MSSVEQELSVYTGIGWLAFETTTLDISQQISYFSQLY